MWGIILFCAGIEAVLSLGWSPGLRQLAYDNFGFWPGLLRNWQPNYAIQPALMFLTYGFLHSGLFHLVLNMITLWSLGGAVIDRVGAARFALLYLGSILGGAGGFALLAETMRPMVGASGALFGLAGGLLAWSYVDRYSVRVSLWPVAQVAGLLIALNLLMWWAMNGLLAWQTHLGGFVTGWVMALLIDPRAQTGSH